jgi:hypothetical protein
MCRIFFSFQNVTNRGAGRHNLSTYTLIFLLLFYCSIGALPWVMAPGLQTPDWTDDGTLMKRFWFSPCMMCLSSDFTLSLLFSCYLWSCGSLLPTPRNGYCEGRKECLRIIDDLVLRLHQEVMPVLECL